MSTKYVLSIDQGTTSSRIVVLDEKSHLVELFSHEFDQIYQDDAVLQDAEMIYQGVKGLLNKVLEKYKKENIVSIGITNQRETTACQLPMRLVGSPNIQKKFATLGNL